jgi:basic membrane lipoprotein Med (substrate-binding protein (PBP1-ABC) superfamily)
LAISRRLLGLGASAALIFAACGPGTGSSTAPTTPAATQPGATSAGGETTAPTQAGSAKKTVACVAFDTGGLGDKGFNDLAK